MISTRSIRKRKVPTVIWNEETLTEIVAILLELDRTLEPERTPKERRGLLEHCAFVATELPPTSARIDFRLGHPDGLS